MVTDMIVAIVSILLNLMVMMAIKDEDETAARTRQVILFTFPEYECCAKFYATYDTPPPSSTSTSTSPPTPLSLTPTTSPTSPAEVAKCTGAQNNKTSDQEPAW